MSVRRILFALLLSCGLALAADNHPKPLKVHKHAVSTPKAAKHGKQAAKGVKHKPPKVAKHKVSTPKIAKHKQTKFKKHKA
jgi:hypothetical protein